MKKYISLWDLVIKNIRKAFKLGLKADK